MSQIVLSSDIEYAKKLARVEELRKAEKHRRERRIRRARNDYQAFAEHVMQDELTGEKIKLAQIHKQWVKHIDTCWSNGLGAIILAPFGHGKTNICSISIPLYLFGHDPTLRIVLASANDKLAQERLVLVRKYIDHSEEYHELFPNVRADQEQGWTKGFLFLQRTTFAKDPSISACGATSSAVGKRLDILILDDVSDKKNSILQPRMREAVWGNFTGVFLPRLEPGGRILIIATRWHVADLVGKILSSEGMINQYGILIQRVSEDFTCIDSETIIPRHMPEGVRHRAELENLFRLYERGVI
jgi:hypothetical protein